MSAAPHPDDPPPFEVLNPEGTAPVLLLCDHASRALPRAYGSLGLEETEMWRHIAWDIGAADVTRRLSALLDAPAVLSGYSRLLADCNRAPDDSTFICAESDGSPIPGNRDIDAAERQRRLDAYHSPYHEAVAAQIARMQRRIPAPALVDLHSFTPVMDGIERPWHAGILWDRDPRLARPLIRILAEDEDLVVGDNQPYTGRGHLGYSMARHGAAGGLPHATVEIRQDLIDTHHGAEDWAARRAAVIRRILDAAAAGGGYRVERF